MDSELNFGPLTDEEGAKLIARKLWKQYCKNNSSEL